MAISDHCFIPTGTKGLIASPNPLASAAGIEILNRGGNAADAAVATAAVLNVVDPGMCGIGGDAFCLFFNASDRSLKGLNGSGRSPAALTLAKARELGITGDELPLRNINSSVSIPIALDSQVFKKRRSLLTCQCTCYDIQSHGARLVWCLGRYTQAFRIWSNFARRSTGACYTSCRRRVPSF